MSRKVALLLVGVFCLVAVARALDLESDEWLAYKAKYGKLYESRVEESMRHSIFMKNKQRIEQHNRGASSSFKMGLNHLSDRTEAELQQSRGFQLPENHELMVDSAQGEQYLAELLGDSSSDSIPKEVDWRNETGRVTKVKNQGFCGSCWAFSTTGLLEGQMAKVTKAKEMISLSEQNLVDCVVQHGCQGSWPVQALFAIFEEDGINSEKSYPYGGVEHKCRFNQSAVVMQTRGPIVLPQDEEVIKAVLAKYGPVSVAIDAEGLDSYENGVYSNKHCGKKISQLNHAVLLVGYGTDPKEGDYWLVKNSWGKFWGQMGFGKFARNKDNMCGIATLAVIAAFDKYQA